MNKDQGNSERQLEQKAVELFENKFQKLTVLKSNYSDVIEMLAAVIHSDKVRKIVNDKYLQYKGYNPEEVGENGKNFIRQKLEQVKANGNGEEPRRDASELMRMVNTTPAWKDVDEALPETNIMILCFGENGMFEGWLASDGETWKTFECDIVDGKANSLRKDKLENVTHWMHLPKPPSNKT